MLSSRIKQVMVFTAIILFAAFAYASVITLGTSGLPLPKDRYTFLSLIQFAFALPALLIWLGWNVLVGAVFLALAFMIALLATAVLGGGFIWVYLFFYLTLFITFYLYDRRHRDDVCVLRVDCEKNAEEFNKLTISIREHAKTADASLKKYTRYYSLREVVERFASTLSLQKLSNMIVEEALTFVGGSDLCLLYLSDPHESTLSLVASRSVREGDEHVRIKQGDLFDWWVLRSRQRLLVQDVSKDFRFDSKRSDADPSVKSVIIAPLMREARVVGTLRVNSKEADRFSTEELRILDLISGIASSALANALLYERTEELAIRDSLTGLYVQRYFRNRLSEDHHRSLLSNAPLSLLMLDLDFFKSYNDRYGHGAGDVVLCKVSAVMKEVVGEHGIVSRYGGEEFAVILPNIESEAAREIAEKIRKRVEETSIDIRRENTHITISIGVSNFPNDTLDREELLEKADQCLYRAKKEGRNTVCTSAS